MNKPNPRAKPLELILILGALSTRMEKVSHRSVKNLVFSPGAPILSITARVFFLRAKYMKAIYPIKQVKNCI